jgi:hypothetical protein
VISKKVALQAGLIIEKSEAELINASGDPMTVLGESTLMLANDKHSVQCTALIVSDCSQSVLVSWHDLQKLGIIPGTFPACANSARIKCLKDIIVCEFPEVFTDKLPDLRSSCARK